MPTAELAYDLETPLEHQRAHPDGCPALCRECCDRLALRCAESAGHVWAVDFAYGDTCYCGQFYLLRRADGRIEVRS